MLGAFDQITICLSDRHSTLTKTYISYFVGTIRTSSSNDLYVNSPVSTTINPSAAYTDPDGFIFEILGAGRFYTYVKRVTI